MTTRDQYEDCWVRWQGNGNEEEMEEDILEGDVLAEYLVTVSEDEES